LIAGLVFPFLPTKYNDITVVSPPKIKILPYAVWDFYQKIILNLKEVLSKNPPPNCKVKAML